MSKKKKLGDYPFIQLLILSWKPRAKKHKIKLKNLAAQANIPPSHLTRIISRKTKNPHPQRINDIEMALISAEKDGGEE